MQFWTVDDQNRAVAYGTPIFADPVGVNMVAFSQDGGAVAVAAGGGNLAPPPTAPSVAMRWICATIPTALTPQLWTTDISGLGYDPPCSSGS